MLRFRSIGLYVIALLAVSFSAGCRLHRAAERRAARERDIQARIAQAEAAIRGATVEWSKATQAKDLDKAVSYYADDAIQFADRGPVVRGKENIRKGWQLMLALPGPGLTFETTGVEVGRSADFAWEHGTYDFATADKQGKVTDVKGKYLVVWKKQADGSWKVAADMDNTGQ